MRTFALEPRLSPSQERSRETVEGILEAAAALLDEVGVEGFNTNRLAEFAGVRVRTIYRYFPNKLSVISVLAARMTEEWNRWFEDAEQLADPDCQWREVWCDYIDGFVTGIRALPGAAAVRRAMHAIPELRDIDQKDNAQLAERLAKILRVRNPQQAPEESEAAARALLESAVAIVDVALLESGQRAESLIEALKEMHLAYLSNHFEGAPQ